MFPALASRGMRAEALVCEADGSVALEPVELPDPGPGAVGIRTLRSGMSIGTERNLLRGNVSWGPFPICTGYQAVGVVETVGEDVAAFEAGDTVYYRDSAALERPDGTEVSATAGTHCSRAVVEPAFSGGIGRVPQGVDPDPASLFVMPAVGLNGVDRAGVRMADVVAVQGVGLIGLGAVAASHRRGARVVAIDPDADRLAVAEAFGADHAVNPTDRDPGDAVDAVAPGGADAVFEATGNPDLIDDAMTLCGEEGTFVFQGDYGDRDVSFYFRRPHHNQFTAVFPCNDGGRPGRRAVLAAMASGALPWERAITHRFAPGEAPDLYDRIADGHVEDVLGAVVDWTRT
jgi:2-desacetyl-2-hydroxyethyl bacteriochlorophyllide A dehydrogenase